MAWFSPCSWINRDRKVIQKQHQCSKNWHKNENGPSITEKE